ncbi:MAG: respiratory nitrate reductase subunit gamma [Thermodesulfobacteriota bacterium]
MHFTITGFLIGLVLPYATILVVVVGSVVRLVIWIRAPKPFPVTLGPAPRTRFGLAARLVGDLLLFPTLFRSDKVLWIGVWILHMSLLVVILGHVRYFIYPVPEWAGIAREFALPTGYVLTLAVIALLARKGCHERLAYLTRASDLWGLLLLLGVSATGLLLAYLHQANEVEVKAFLLGLAFARPEPIPSSVLFRIHFGLGCVLVCYFPLGRLVHALGWLVSPTSASREIDEH